MFYSEYRTAVVEHQKRIDDMARTARKQDAIKAGRSKTEIEREKIAQIKNCEYDQMPSERQEPCID